MKTTENVGYAEANQITGINTNTLYALVHAKRIPHLRIGKRHVLFPVAELREWLEQHRVVSFMKVSKK